MKYGGYEMNSSALGKVRFSFGGDNPGVDPSIAENPGSGLPLKFSSDTIHFSGNRKGSFTCLENRQLQIFLVRGVPHDSHLGVWPRLRVLWRIFAGYSFIANVPWSLVASVHLSRLLSQVVPGTD